MPTSSLDFLIHIFCGLVPAGCAAASVTWGWVVSVCDRLCPMGAEQHLCINCWCGLDRVRCPGGGSLHPRGPRLPLDGWWHLGRPILITDAFLPGISGAPVLPTSSLRILSYTQLPFAFYFYFLLGHTTTSGLSAFYAPSSQGQTPFSSSLLPLSARLVPI